MAHSQGTKTERIAALERLIAVEREVLAYTDRAPLVARIIAQARDELAALQGNRAVPNRTAHVHH